MRRRIILGAVGVAVVSLLIGAATAVIVRGALEDRTRQELFRQAEATADLLERELAGVALRQVPARVDEILETARLVGGHDYVEAAAIRNGEPVPLGRTPVLLPLLSDGLSDRAFVELDVGGVPVLAVARLVRPEARIPVVIVIGRSEPLVSARAVTGPLLLALGIGLLLAAALAMWLAQRLGRRLDRLAEASRSIAAGDLSVRLPVDGDDELAAVAHAFNDMGARLEDAQRRERDFLMSVGHDLRTPLTTIRGYAEALEAGDIPAEDLARVASVLGGQAGRLGRLVEDLSLLARLEARQFTLRPEPVDLAAHVTEVAGGYRERAAGAGITLDVVAVPTGRVHIDPDRVAQIVANLLENALRYTPERGVVEVRMGPLASGVQLEVSDTGPGIDPVDLPHVFERLYVAQRYRPVRAEGSGLGLSIVKELVEAMGGRVAVTSRLGKGTTVTIELAASRATAQSTAAATL